MRPLTPKELEDLESFIGTSNDGKLRDRARMVLWFHKRNMTIHEIADLMDKHPDGNSDFYSNCYASCNCHSDCNRKRKRDRYAYCNPDAIANRHAHCDTDSHAYPETYAHAQASSDAAPSDRKSVV